MKDGFIKIAACSPKIRLGDPKFNADIIIAAIEKAAEAGCALIAFPELVMTGCTMGDLFEHEALLDCVKNELIRIMKETEPLQIISIIGAPVRMRDKLLNCAAVISPGNAIRFIAKQNLPAHGGSCDARLFAPLAELDESNNLGEAGWINPADSVIEVEDVPNFVIGVELGDDLFSATPPSCRLAERGALLIINCAAESETVGSAEYRKKLAEVQSARTLSAYLYAGAGAGESTADEVFSGHCFCFESGTLLSELRPFENEGELMITEIDVGRLLYERRRVTGFNSAPDDKKIYLANLKYTDPNEIGEIYPNRDALPETKLTRKFDKNPFLPKTDAEIAARANEILTIQAMGLKRRLEHIGAKAAVIGISGGLDSSLALLVCAKACDLMGAPRSMIKAVTMPCFGTTERTKNNAVELSEALGASVKTIDITLAVRQHFFDIGHNEQNHNVVYENAQARMRTLVLMDIANAENGLVVGTGDLSELALGWATYNGDHMSMYGVNAGVPKTLLKYIVQHYADACGDERVKTVLYSILATPISPELLPPDEGGNIAQITEELVGPYELHDFFLYYVLRWGYPPKKLYRVAKEAFRGSEFTDEIILKWLKSFYRRFFTQQFKRNCLPDGVKIGSVGLSPRGDWRMPSDASCRIWLDELETLSPIRALPKE